MITPQAYAEELAALRGLLTNPARGIHLVEFATIPQLEGILADFRAICATRHCVELTYDPPRQSAAELVSSARKELASMPEEPPSLLVLRPIALPDASVDGAAAEEFWKSLNFRREALGLLPAQILLCVDPWHYQHLVDEALDLLSWTMPRFHLIPPADSADSRVETLSGFSAFADLAITPNAARARWKAFWPIVEEQRRTATLQSSAIRTYILPLLESALAVGNLMHARQIRDAATGIAIPSEDLVEWHRLNAIFACGSGDLTLAQDHAEALLSLVHSARKNNDRQKAALALGSVANLIQACGDYHTAARFFEQLIPFFTKTLGPEHPNTLGSRNNLANALSDQGKYAEAEKQHRAILEIRERILGSEASETLSSRINLSNTLFKQENYLEAEAEFRAILAILGRVFPEDHPYVLATRNNRASTLRAHGKYQEAESENRAVLDIRERTLGSDHPDTLSSRNNLANILHALGKLAEAEAEHREVLDVRKRILGAEHPLVFLSYCNLARVLAEQGKTAEALDLAKKGLVGHIHIFGLQHPETVAAKALVDDLEAELRNK